MIRATASSLGLLVALLVGCGGGDSAPADGEERGPCYGNGTCNAGLTCLSDVCVRAPDAGPPADAGASDASPALDAARADAGPADAGPADAGGLDASAPDAAPPDAAGDAAVDAGPSDAGPPDTGAPDAGPPDTGAPDAGPRPDAGPEPMCNPVSGVGCPGTADFCLWDPRFDLRSCGPPNGNVGLEVPCNEALQNCAPGHACVRTGNQPAPECHRVCDVFAGGLSCQGLNGRHPLYNCSVINGSRQYGVCLGRGTFCDPLAPACPSGEVCSFDGAGQTTCQPAGSTSRDQACSVVANCAPGQGICIDLGSGGFCRLACDPATSGTCGSSARCVQITGRPFGVCLPVSCNPFTSPCPSGFVCSAVTGPVECRPAGGVGIGGACGPNQECAAGVCVALSSAGPRCEQPCDANNPCAAPAACVTLNGFGFGVCR